MPTPCVPLLLLAMLVLLAGTCCAVPSGYTAAQAFARYEADRAKSVVELLVEQIAHAVETAELPHNERECVDTHVYHPEMTVYGDEVVAMLEQGLGYTRVERTSCDKVDTVLMTCATQFRVCWT